MKFVDNAKQVWTHYSTKALVTLASLGGVWAGIPDEIKNYDLVYMIDVFHHIPRAQQISFMQQLQQKMKAGAVLIFKDIDGGSPLVLCNKMHDMVFAGEIGKEISFTKAKSMLIGAGFKITESFKKTVFVYAHYFVICQK